MSECIFYFTLLPDTILLFSIFQFPICNRIMACVIIIVHYYNLYGGMIYQIKQKRTLNNNISLGNYKHSLKCRLTFWAQYMARIVLFLLTFGEFRARELYPIATHGSTADSDTDIKLWARLKNRDG